MCDPTENMRHFIKIGFVRRQGGTKPCNWHFKDYNLIGWAQVPLHCELQTINYLVSVKWRCNSASNLRGRK